MKFSLEEIIEATGATILKNEVGVDDKLISKPGASNEGMVIDFGDLKQIMMNVIDKQYDHSFMIYDKDSLAETFVRIRDGEKMKINIVHFIPTAENIAQYFFLILRERLHKKKIFLSYVKIWETPTSTATYTFENYYDKQALQ